MAWLLGLAMVPVAALIGMVSAVAEGGGDPVVGALVSYGVAAPVVLVLYKQAQDAKKERDAQALKVESLTDRLLQQQAASLPVLTEAVAVIRATADRDHR